MRLFIAVIVWWVFCGGIAALLYWVIGPMVTAHGAETIANVDASEPGSIGTVFTAALWGPLTSMVLPAIFIAAALGGTVKLLTPSRR